MIEEHFRNKIWTSLQHPYKHAVSDFAYINDALPGVTNIESALDWILAVLYPNQQPAVADVGSLPLVGNTINDYRVVLDDGDGKAASYRWEQREGDASPSWYKIYDMDWGESSVLSNFLNKTQDVYAYKAGIDDLDSSGNPIVGTLAGQTLYGGASANTNLTLFANSGDGVGVNTGFVQIGDNFRPITDNAFDIGTATERIKDIYLSNSTIINTMTISSGSIIDSTGTIDFDNENLVTTGQVDANTASITTSLDVATMTIAGGSITDSSGAIDFGNENLSTTGTLESGTHTIGNLVLASGSITNISGTIDFDNENLTTTGSVSGGDADFTLLDVDNIRLDLNTISITNLNGNLNLLANGTGVIDLQSPTTSLNLTVTGILDVTGQIDIDNLRLDGNILSSTNLNGNIELSPNGTGSIVPNANVTPGTDNSHSLGLTGSRYTSLFLSTSIGDGTNVFTMSDFMTLRNVPFRDAARTQPAQAGDALFYDAVSGTFLASAPDSEIDHGTLSGILDDDHTQYLLLAGRSGGQEVIGGTDANDNLTLESTSNATKGFILVKDDLAPNTDASFAAGWNGTDLGDASRNFRDLYMKGEAHGFRVENFLDAGLPASSGQNIGRLAYATDTKKLYIDTGTSLVTAGVSKHVEDLVFNGTDTTKDVDVSANITDARNAIKQLFDNADDFNPIYCDIKAISATTVRIVTGSALPAGSYRLIVIE